MAAIHELKEKLKNRENILSSMICDIGHTSLPNLYKECGVDFLVLDLEHGSFFPENIGDFMYLCNLMDIPAIIRVQDCEYYHISKPLDMGADGILIPRAETIQQVETAINSMRIYPKGKKGIGGRALIHQGETVYDINENRLLFLQIESKQGIDQLDEILTKYGDEVAGIIIGPCDLSVSLGCGLELDKNPRVVACIDETIAICKKHNKSIGMFMCEAEKKWYDRGMNIFWTATEEILLIQALTRIKEQMDSFGK